MMNCKETRERLDSYLDHQLETGEDEAMRLHLESCPECKKEYDVLHLLQELGRECQQEAPPELCSGVMERIQKIVPMETKRRKIHLPFSLIAAAAIFLMVISLNGNELKTKLGLGTPPTESTEVGLVISNLTPYRSGNGEQIGTAPGETDPAGPAPFAVYNGVPVFGEDGTCTLSDGTILYDDPIVSYGTEKYGFITAVKVSADLNVEETLKNLTKIATVGNLYYFKVIDTLLEGIYSKLGSDLNPISIKSDLFLEKDNADGILIVYQLKEDPKE